MQLNVIREQKQQSALGVQGNSSDFRLMIMVYHMCL